MNTYRVVKEDRGTYIPAQGTDGRTWTSYRESGWNQQKSFESISNYGFLDGHAAGLRFRAVYVDFQNNRMDPEAAR